MPLNQYGLGLIFTAKDQASGTMSKIGKTADTTSEQAERMQERFWQASKQMAKGTAMIAGGITALRGMGRLVGEFAGFESVIASTAAIAGASQKQYKDLFKAAQAAGKATIFSPQQAAMGMRTLAMAGLDVKASITALNPVLEMATASFGQLSPEQAAGLATMAMKSFGIEADKLRDAVGRMVFATNSANMSMRDLQLGLSVAARGAIATKQSLGETLIALGLTKNVVKGTERASTSLAVAMERLARPTVQKQLKKTMGVTVQVGGKFRSFLDVVQDVTTATAKMTDVKRAATLQDIFGAEASLSLLAIMKQIKDGIKTQSGEIVKGAQAVEFLRQRMEGAKDVSKIMTEKYMRTMEGQMRLLKGSAETLRIAVGGLFARTWMPLVRGAVFVLNKLIEGVSALPGPLKDLIAFGVPLAALTVTLWGVVKVVGALKVMAQLATAAKAAGAATTGLAASWKAAAGIGGKLLTVTRAARGGLIGLGVAVAGVAASWVIGKFVRKLEEARAKLKRETDAVRAAEKAHAAAKKAMEGENQSIVKIIQGIKNRKTARQALNKIETMSTEREKKVLTRHAALLVAIEERKKKDSAVNVQRVREARHLFRTELFEFEKIQRGRALATSTGARFELAATKRGSLARLELLGTVGAHEAREIELRRKRLEDFRTTELQEAMTADVLTRKRAVRRLKELQKDLNQRLRTQSIHLIEASKIARKFGVQLPAALAGGPAAAEVLRRPAAIPRARLREQLARQRRAAPAVPTRERLTVRLPGVDVAIRAVAAAQVQLASQLRREPITTFIQIDGETVAKTVRRRGEEGEEREGRVATGGRRR